jgi:hypothetical protein
MTIARAWRAVVVMQWQGMSSDAIWQELLPSARRAYVEPHWGRLCFDGGHLAWGCGGVISLGLEHDNALSG